MTSFKHEGRIPVGRELDVYAQRCPACHAGAGELHRRLCSLEQCEHCGAQRVACQADCKHDEPPGAA